MKPRSPITYSWLKLSAKPAGLQRSGAASVAQTVGNDVPAFNDAVELAKSDEDDAPRRSYGRRYWGDNDERLLLIYLYVYDN